MINRTKLFILIALITISNAIFALASDTFWLLNTIDGSANGPFTKEPGARFSIDGQSYSIMASAPGTILFSTYPTSKYFGPYSFKENHIIHLKDKTYSIYRINDKNTHKPLHQTSTSQTTKPKQEPTTDTTTIVEVKHHVVPVRRDLAPAPTTNPGAFKEPEPFNFSFVKTQRDNYYAIFVEPITETKFNWEIGGYNGNQNSSLERKKIGVFGNYKGFFGEASLLMSQKSSGTLVPNDSNLSNLILDGGNGFSLKGGYEYRFLLDKKWHASVDISAEYSKSNFDMSATALVKSETSTPKDTTNSTTTEELNQPVVSFIRVNESSTITIDELSLKIGFGVDRTSSFWEIGFYAGLFLYSDLSSSGSITLFDKNYDVSAKRSHPIYAELNGWYAPSEEFFINGKAFIGTDTGIRIGIGRFF